MTSTIIHRDSEITNWSLCHLLRLGQPPGTSPAKLVNRTLTIIAGDTKLGGVGSRVYPLTYCKDIECNARGNPPRGQVTSEF